MQSLSFSLSLLLLVVGCSTSAPRPPENRAAPVMASRPASAPARSAAVSDQHVGATEAMLAVMTALNKDLKAAGKDCSKLTAALVAHGDAVKAASTNLAAASDKDREADEDVRDGDASLNATYSERSSRLYRRLELAWAFCEQDPAFTAKLGALELGLPLPEGTREAFEREYQALDKE